MVDLSNYSPDKLYLRIGTEVLLNVERTPMETVKWLRIQYLKELNRALCARRKFLLQWLEEDIAIIFRGGYHEKWYEQYQKRQNEVFTLNVKIEANGREILRLRGNKWSF